MEVVTKARLVYHQTESIIQTIQNRPESLFLKRIGGKTKAKERGKDRPGLDDPWSIQYTTKLYLVSNSLRDIASSKVN
jgi:hypothetical protein